MSLNLEEVTGWCDGSTHGGTGVSSVIIITEDTHLVSINTPLHDIKDSTETELYGAFTVLKFMHENYKDKYSNITVNIDSESIVKTFEKLQSTNSIYRVDKYEELWESILVYSEDFKVKFKHFRGHATDLNPNKVVDVKGRMLRRCGMDML